MSTYRHGDYERELGSLDLDDDGGEWEPCYLPGWFLVLTWGGLGVLIGYLLGLWKATH
jgi:hypothetical protein